MLPVELLGAAGSVRAVAGARAVRHVAARARVLGGMRCAHATGGSHDGCRSALCLVNRQREPVEGGEAAHASLISFCSTMHIY